MEDKTELKQNQKIFIEVFEKNACNIKQTCKKVNIDRQTYYNWMSSNSTFKKAINDCQEGLIDFAETKLMEKIKDGDTTANIFFLKTKGKGRGYVEKVEQVLSGSLGIEKAKWTLED